MKPPKLPVNVSRVFVTFDEQTAESTIVVSPKTMKFLKQHTQNFVVEADRVIGKFVKL